MDVLQMMHARGYTFGEISKKLPGRSRAACISKAHKLGIYGADGPIKRRQQAARLQARRALTTPVEDRHV